MMKKIAAVIVTLSFVSVLFAQNMSANQLATHPQPETDNAFKSCSDIFANYDVEDPTPEQQLILSVIPEDAIELFLEMAENIENGGSIQPQGMNLLQCGSIFFIGWYVVPWQLGTIMLIYLIFQCF